MEPNTTGQKNHRNSKIQIYDYRIHKEYECLSNVWFAIIGQKLTNTTAFYFAKYPVNIFSDMEYVQLSRARIDALLAKFAKKHYAIPVVLHSTGELYYHHQIIEEFIKALKNGRIEIEAE